MKPFVFLLAATAFAAKPSAVSGLPTAAVGPSTVLTFTGRDKDGATDIGWMYFLVNTSATIPANTCHGLYDRAANAFYLYTDDLSWAEGPLAPGAAASIENSQCAVEGSSSAALATGNDLVVKLAITVKSPFGDTNKSVYLWVKDKQGQETGWVKTGTWAAVPPQPSTPAMAQIFDTFDPAGASPVWLTQTPVAGWPIAVYAQASVLSPVGVVKSVDPIETLPATYTTCFVLDGVRISLLLPDATEPRRVQLPPELLGRVQVLYWVNKQ